MDQQTSHK